MAQFLGYTIIQFLRFQRSSLQGNLSHSEAKNMLVVKLAIEESASLSEGLSPVSGNHMGEQSQRNSLSVPWLDSDFDRFTQPLFN
jgi:hypothetical protein